MLLVLEIAMLIGGIYALATGKFPDFLVGKKAREEYMVPEGPARMLGVLMILPLPCAFAFGFVIGLTATGDIRGIVTIVEFIVVIGAAIAMMLIYRSVRKPKATEPVWSKAEEDIYSG